MCIVAFVFLIKPGKVAGLIGDINSCLGLNYGKIRSLSTYYNLNGGQRMFEEHPCFNTPSDDTKIWRYMDFTKFVNLLDTKSLFFVRSDKFDDPFEGLYPEKISSCGKSHLYYLLKALILIFIKKWNSSILGIESIQQ